MNIILSSILWLIVAISSANLYAEALYVKNSHAELGHAETGFSWQTVMQEIQSSDIVQGEWAQFDDYQVKVLGKK